MDEPEKPQSPDAWKNPFCLSFLVCDAIHRDAGTGKNYIIGTFSVFGALTYPTALLSMAVYVALTDGRGKIPFKLQLIDVDEEREPLFSAEFELEFIDPLAVLEGSFSLGNLVIPEPGEYRLQLFANSDPMMERRIIALPPSNPEPPHAEQTDG